MLRDGKPGHENQSRGLAEALRRKVGARIVEVLLPDDKGPFGRFFELKKTARDMEKPDMILAAGHSTHLPLLWLARNWRIPSVVLMKPSLPLSWFTYCIAPEHDFPEGKPRPANLILTRGALNRVVSPHGERSGKIILIGGPSKTHAWNGEELLAALAEATNRGGWELSDSRRTPDDFLDQARARLPGVRCHSHRDTAADWVPESLSRAREVWVTEDSVSMIYEALTGGARVGLLPARRKAHASRVLRGIDRLIAENYVTPYVDWRACQRLISAPEPLAEADRCADLLLAALCP